MLLVISLSIALRAVPPSAPFKPWSANAINIAVVSSTLKPKLLAVAAQFLYPSANC